MEMGLQGRVALAGEKGVAGQSGPLWLFGIRSQDGRS